MQAVVMAVLSAAKCANMCHPKKKKCEMFVCRELSVCV